LVRSHELTNTRKSFIPWNESYLTRLNLRYATVNFPHLSLHDLMWDVVGQSFHKPLCKFRTLINGELLSFLEKVGYNLSHECKVTHA
jgi:hypothetical protein